MHAAVAPYRTGATESVTRSCTFFKRNAFVMRHIRCSGARKMAATLERSFIEICGFERETVSRFRDLAINLGKTEVSNMFYYSTTLFILIIKTWILHKQQIQRVSLTARALYRG